MRLTSQLWVAAYIRKVNSNGAFAVVARRGAEHAGAIHITVEAERGALALYSPAPQTDMSAESGDRRFRKAGDALDPLALRDILDREARFDPDFWVIGVDDREGRHFLGDDLVEDQS